METLRETFEHEHDVTTSEEDVRIEILMVTRIALCMMGVTEHLMLTTLFETKSGWVGREQRKRKECPELNAAVSIVLSKFIPTNIDRDGGMCDIITLIRIQHLGYIPLTESTSITAGI